MTLKILNTLNWSKRIILLSVLPLAACATSSTQVDHDAFNQIASRSKNQASEVKAKESIVKKGDINHSYILQSCKKNTNEISDVALIRKQIQKDLQEIGIGNSEIERQLNLYDFKTCDLR
jgi:septal ring factor EnvC (AmiA/AmiB activator)